MFPRTKTSLTLAGVVLLVMASVGSAVAQGQGGRRGGMFGRGNNPLQLLRNKSVQEELKMTPPQVEKLDAKQQELQQARREAFQNAQNSDPAARQTMMAKMQEMQDKAIADILDNTQQRRFKQIQLQQEGPSAITRKEVAEELKLTDDQKAKVKAIQDDERTQIQGMMQGVDFRNMPAEDRQKLMEKGRALQKDFQEKYAAVLTSDQKTQWKKMLGEPFKMVQPEAGGRPAA